MELIKMKYIFHSCQEAWQSNTWQPIGGHAYSSLTRQKEAYNHLLLAKFSAPLPLQRHTVNLTGIYQCRTSKARGDHINPYSAKVFLFKPWRLKGFFHFEIIINGLVSCFRFIRILRLSGYGSTTFRNIWIILVFIRQNLILTYKNGPLAERVNHLCGFQINPAAVFSE